MIEKTKESDNAQSAWTGTPEFDERIEVEREFLRGVYFVLGVMVMIVVFAKLFT